VNYSYLQNYDWKRHNCGIPCQRREHLREEFEHIKDVNPHAGERGGEIEAKCANFSISTCPSDSERQPVL